MDDKAQISFEYFTILAVLSLIAAIIMVFTTSLFVNKEGVKSAMAAYKDRLIEMWG